MIERFIVEMNKVERVIRKKIVWRGLVQSASYALPFLASAGTWLYGGLMVADEEIDFKNVVK